MSTATTQLANRSGEAEIIPYGDRPGGEASVRRAMEELNVIRQFVASEMKKDHDFGIIPGTGGKPTLYLPGAQKIAMFFNTCPDYHIQPSELGNGHVEYLVTTKLVSRTSGLVVGSGLGSCSTMEKKYRWRGAARVCPHCDAAAIIKSRYNPGWYCNPKAGGCGSTFATNEKGIAQQSDKPAENPDIHDSRNTVLKMAKKRSLVDASLGLGCLAEMFTQDLDDYVLDPEAPEAETPGPPDNNSGHGRTGAYASPETINAFLAALGPIVEHGQDRWENLCDRYATGEVPRRYRDEMIRGSYACRHLIKTAEAKGLIKAPADVVDPATGKTRSGAKDHQLHGLAALAWQRDGGWAEAEVRAWLDTAIAKGQAKLVKEGLLDPADFPVDPEPSPEDESQEREPGADG